MNKDKLAAAIADVLYAYCEPYEIGCYGCNMKTLCDLFIDKEDFTQPAYEEELAELEKKVKSKLKGEI